MTDDRGRFDSFAAKTSGFVSRAPFFVACVVLVLVWAPSYFAFGSIDTWQLVINTITTIVTFLLVALLQNSAARSEKATSEKLNAIAEGLADLMVYVAVSTLSGGGNPGPKLDPDRLRRDAKELKRAVGLEDRVGA